MATDFGTGGATNVTNAIIGVAIQQLMDVMKLGENLQLLTIEFARMEVSLRHIQTQFEVQQRQLPVLVESCLGRINEALEEAKPLILRANRQRERGLGCCLFCNPKIPAEIREWKTTFGELFQQLQSDLSIAATTTLIVESAQPRAEGLLQPIPDSGLVGSGIQDALVQLLRWLNEPHPQAWVIGLYGMAGVGKTTFLKLIYNNCKTKVSCNFDFVIWLTISQNYQLKNLQDAIAHSLDLKFEPSFSFEMRKMKLYAFFQNKKFLLIMDDLWSPIDLDEVGVKVGHDNGTKVLISSRSRDVVESMAENEYCMKIQPLSEVEGWELFRSRAFRSGVAPDNNIEAIAREFASELKGLPLAINVIAAAMARKNTAEEWCYSLNLMKSGDLSFPDTQPSIDRHLYQRLRWSYDDLPNSELKMCFLYCAAFPKDAWIEVETLVGMWAAEGLISLRRTFYFMDIGREYIDVMVSRSLIEYIGVGYQYIKVPGVFHDMAIYFAQKENLLFLSGLHLQHFPSEEKTRDCKRISIVGGEISDLPPDFNCPTLLSLQLAKNTKLKKIPESFLVNLTSLRVLDLSWTPIQVLPTSVGQLRQLEFLNLRGCKRLMDLPESIWNLPHLKFLNIEECGLNSLPDRIAELKNIKLLKFSRY